ncbi:hypothetical protein PHMEG_0003241 [Phytophthora megakarya]|uniref:Uncharacterized protein n=1 Tax=Phytophthora megakarya TaxID=4795 RepID=A0A225WZ34_9STRA|nr:hypothetical protein PHMEG_0003241 [Phytophthora megakarya]
MKLFVAPKIQKRTWSEHYKYLIAISDACGPGSEYMVVDGIVQYGVLKAKVDSARVHYPQHAEKLAHFAQTWETDQSKGKDFGREMVVAVNERRIENLLDEMDDFWILESGSIRYLVKDASWLDDAESCED